MEGWREGPSEIRQGCWELLIAGSRMGWGDHRADGLIILSLAFFT